jgi:hypothetical protein
MRVQQLSEKLRDGTVKVNGRRNAVVLKPKRTLSGIRPAMVQPDASRSSRQGKTSESSDIPSRGSEAV